MLVSSRLGRLFGAAAAALLAANASASVRQEWVVRWDASGPDLQGAARQVLVDGAGSARMLADYGGLLVARFDAAGARMWDVVLAGRGLGPGCPWCGPTRGAALDPAGTLFVPDGAGRLLQIDAAGTVVDDVDLSARLETPFATVGAAILPGGGLVVAGNVTALAGDGDVLVARLDAALRPVWKTTLGRPGAADGAAFLRVGQQGQIVVAGSTDLALAVWTLDAAGTVQVEATGPFMSVAGFDVDAAGGFAADGNDLVPDGAGGGSSTGALVTCRLDASGKLLWTATELPYRSPGPLRIAADGSVYVGDASNPNSGMPGYDLLKYGADGSRAWSRLYQPWGDSYIYDLVLDRGEPIVTGEYGYCMDFIETMKHSPAGELLWSVGYAPSYSCGGSVNYGYSLALDPARNVFVAGFTYDPATAVGHYPYKPTLIKYAQYDGTPPATTATHSGTAGANGWFVSPITVWLSAADSPDEASGVREIRWSLDGSAEVVVPGASASVAVSGEGYHTVVASSVDNVGNAEPAQVLSYGIDQTAPAIAASVASTPGSNGWLRAATVTVSATDATSGVASVRFAVGAGAVSDQAGDLASVALPDGVAAVQYGATDWAGNASAWARTATLRVDGTAPAVTVATSPATLRRSNRTQAVRVTGSATDATSGVASTVVRVTDGAGRLVAITAFGRTVYLNTSRTQVYTFTATSTDRAGNQAQAVATVTVR
jgi:hypothetical protein